MAEQETFIERLARERGASVEDIRKLLTARIKAGLNDPDPERRAQWEKIPHAGDIPTPEEYLEYTVKRLHEEGREDLLRRYLID